MRQQDSKDQHTFAFFYPKTTQLSKIHNDVFVIDDRVLCHRIMHVVRLRDGDSFTLFDQQNHSECVLQGVNEKAMRFRIESSACNDVYEPLITLLLPLLKKEAFEEALYAATELGAHTVQLITTKKTQRMFGGAKELERIKRILQAAAEQSKNFSYPRVLAPIPFEQAVVGYEACKKIFFDPEGCPIQDVVSAVKSELSMCMVLLIGPEGDLTIDEKCSVRKNNFVLCRLTPTILRAQQAVALSLGIFRSLFNTE